MDDETFLDTLKRMCKIMEATNIILGFDTEIQEIFYQAYGAKLENIPEEIRTGFTMYDFLETLSKLHSTRKQKIILMYFGIATGEPMPVEKIAEEAGATTDAIKTILYSALKVCRPLERAGKLHDYLPE